MAEEESPQLANPANPVNPAEAELTYVAYTSELQVHGMCVFLCVCVCVWICVWADCCAAALGKIKRHHLTCAAFLRRCHA